MQVEFLCQVDYTCMVNSINWFHTTPDNITTTHIKVGIILGIFFVITSYMSQLLGNILGVKLTFSGFKNIS